jgi:cytochrome P450
VSTEAIDWANDFDLFDDDFVRDPYPIYDELRQSCPVAHTTRRGDTWMPTTYDDVAAVAHDTEHFSSRNVGVVDGPTGNFLVAPPITSDPPFHTSARRLLLPAFSPKAIARLTPITERIADELLADIVPAGRCDAAEEYARHIPVRVIALMLGIPLEEEAQFTDWVVRILQIGPTDPEIGRQASRDVLDYFRGQVERRRDEPGDDLVTFLLQAEMDGAPLTEKHLLGTCFLLLVAGIDTTWSSIGASLWHLATHPDDLARLVAEPDLIETAVEEFLRAYAPVTMARTVVGEVEVGGRPACAGEKMLLTFPAANRDPAHFERADEILIDRERNRHVAFGVGIHRCLGSNLARMELKVAIERWLARIPSFRLADGGEVRWNGGQVRGPRTLPVVFPA